MTSILKLHFCRSYRKLVGRNLSLIELFHNLIFKNTFQFEVNYRYKALLDPAERYGKKRGLCTGLGNGFNWVLTYSLNAIGLIYGTRLVINDFDKPTDEKRYLVGELFSVGINVVSQLQSKPQKSLIL